MEFNILFFLNSVLFGVGLAMDAFSVSIATGLNEPGMKKSRMCGIAGTFGGYQIGMPLIGWLCIRTIAGVFTAFQRFIPWIALALLAYIGGKMIVEGIRGGEDEKPATSFGQLMVQGIATSIDALSVGFTISDYSWQAALVESLIIGVVTFAICMVGLVLGRELGRKLAGRATIVGGIILVGIGLEIFIKGVFF